MGGPRRIGEPRPVAVRAADDGVPRAIGPVAVEAVREEWLVEDRWWTARPLRRHYFELALVDGRALTVFRDPDAGPQPPDVDGPKTQAGVEFSAHQHRGVGGGGGWFFQRA